MEDGADRLADSDRGGVDHIRRVSGGGDEASGQAYEPVLIEFHENDVVWCQIGESGEQWRMGDYE
jgi:hypothetical protein